MQTPSWNDSQSDLLRKICRNFFELAQAHGYTAFLEPNGLDNRMSSLRKICVFTAFIVNNP